MALIREVIVHNVQQIEAMLMLVRVATGIPDATTLSGNKS